MRPRCSLDPVVPSPNGPSLGNIIEAALDNVKVWAYGGCETNEDCDDGLYCNGTETCDSSSCQTGSDPCPGQLCDEDTDSCVECGNGICEKFEGKRGTCPEDCG